MTIWAACHVRGHAVAATGPQNRIEVTLAAVGRTPASTCRWTKHAFRPKW